MSRKLDRTKNGNFGKYKYYEVKDGKVEKKRKECPKCGPGVFMAEHKEKGGKIRYHCGKCGYTVYE